MELYSVSSDSGVPSFSGEDLWNSYENAIEDATNRAKTFKGSYYIHIITSTPVFVAKADVVVTTEVISDSKGQAD